MFVIRPITITPAMVTASNAGAFDADYSPATSYALGQRVYLPADGRTYECIQAPALNRAPASNPLYWMRAAPSNRWAMFDAEISTATQVAGGLTATLAVPERVNAMGLFGLQGDSVTLVQKSAAGAVLWSETRLLRSNPSGWYSYFYEPREQVRDAVFTGLVPSTGGRIEVSIAGSACACAAAVVGNVLDLGDAQFGFTASISSYSKKDTNVNTGVQTLKKGPRSKRMSGVLQQPRARFNAVFAALEALDATPAVWVGVPGSGDYEPFNILGFYKDFSIEVSGPVVHLCSLEIEGLTT